MKLYYAIYRDKITGKWTRWHAGTKAECRAEIEWRKEQGYEVLPRPVEKDLSHAVGLPAN
jgi:hypothetical protein